MNKYYKISDMSATYRIAMGTSMCRLFQCMLTALWLSIVLHPGHKMRYFEDARWPAQWLKNAREMVREEYDDHYAFRDVGDGPASDSATRGLQDAELPEVSSRLPVTPLLV